jgi:hypothetical protein
MAEQRTVIDDDDAPPPRAAVAAARRAEMEDAREGVDERVTGRGPSIVIAVIVVILTVASMIAVWAVQ